MIWRTESGEFGVLSIYLYPSRAGPRAEGASARMKGMRLEKAIPRNKTPRTITGSLRIYPKVA